MGVLFGTVCLQIEWKCGVQLLWLPVTCLSDKYVIFFNVACRTISASASHILARIISWKIFPIYYYETSKIIVS